MRRGINEKDGNTLQSFIYALRQGPQKIRTLNLHPRLKYQALLIAGKPVNILLANDILMGMRAGDIKVILGWRYSFICD